MSRLIRIALVSAAIVAPASTSVFAQLPGGADCQIVTETGQPAGTCKEFQL